MGTIIFDTVTLTYFLKTLTLLITFEQWDPEIWYFTWIFPVMRPFRGYHYFWYFWTVRAIALIFHTDIPCDKTFSWVPLFFNLWHWPWRLTYFLKTLTLIISFEQWVQELWYFTWIFPVIGPFHGYHYFWHYFLKTLTLLITFEQWDLEIWYFTWVFLEIWYFTWAFPCDPFRGYHYFF